MVSKTCIYLILTCAVVCGRPPSLGVDEESAHMFSVLSEEILKLKAENAIIKTELNDLKAANGQCASQQELTGVKYGLETLRSSLEGRNRRLEPIVIQPEINPTPHTVAFHAVMPSHVENLGIHQTVTFQQTNTNIGHGYDNKTSVFKAPVRGVYYFSSNIMTHLAEDIEVELVKNGGNEVQIYLGNGDSLAVGTLSAVLELDVGDDVWMRTFDNKAINNGNVRVYGYGWSWFSGFLISH